MAGRPARYVPGLPTPSRPLVMGIVNVTPDSFSDGGLWLDPGAAIAHGEALLEQGADLVEVGGESTRPGVARTSAEEEQRRVLPVVRALTVDGALVCIDTMRAEVARAAVEAGACLVNDVSGGLADPAMLPFVARAGVPYVCMHWRGHSVDMQARATYRDVVAEVRAELSDRIAATLRAGIDPDRLIIDPGLGYAKTAEHNWALLGALRDLAALGHPILVGASRKSFLGLLLADRAGGEPRPTGDRDAATAAISALAVSAGVWCVRVHTVPSTLDAVRVAARLALT
ncbi:dihydropteroate synthase [Actinopolymorpha pittospori]